MSFFYYINQLFNNINTSTSIHYNLVIKKTFDNNLFILIFLFILQYFFKNNLHLDRIL